MSAKKDDTRKKIIEITAALLDETENPDDITMRRIAEAAGIGVGLINYHFVSRENLINEVVSMKMVNLAEMMENVDGYTGDPVQYLKNMLIKMSDIAMKDRKLNKISIEHELLKGDFKICLYLLPILKRIFGDERSETDLRLLAFQIITATQAVYLREEAFYLFTGLNIASKADRDTLIDLIVDNLIK